MSKVIKKQRDIEKSTLNTIDKSKKIEKDTWYGLDVVEKWMFNISMIGFILVPILYFILAFIFRLFFW
jgi:hypothetical protein